MRSGYIKLWRFSEESAEYFLEPFTRWQAWVDLLLMANYKEARVCVRGIVVTVGKGQVLAGEDYLADRWKWSRGKVRRYLAYLSSETVQQIVQQKSNVVGLISIVNWERYQSNGDGDSTTDSTPNGTTDGQQIVQQTVHTKEEYKKNKKDISPKGFDSFWLAYPRKVSKQQALKSWTKLKPDDALIEKMMQSLEVAKTTEQWQRDGGNFIPHPATWLNNKRWEDEIPEELSVMEQKWLTR